MIRFGKFQMSSDVFYTLLAVGILAYLIFAGIPVPFINPTELIVIVVIFLIARAFLPHELLRWIMGIFLMVIILKTLFSLPFATLIIGIILLLFILGLFSR